MTLALFDFDGTLTYKDSFTAFLKSTCSPIIFYWRYYALCLPALLAYKRKKIDTQTLKSARVDAFLCHLPADILEQKIEFFTENILPNLVKKSGLARIKWHLQEGHRIVIVSASFDFLLKNWCEKLDIELITNTLAHNPDGTITSVFLNADCNYHEKTNRIKSYLNISDYTEIYAYGDTDGDKPMLALAQHPHFCLFQ